MNIEYIMDDCYSPKERRKLLMKEYITLGLHINCGNRKHTAKFLGISIRKLRIFMADNPELREEFPPNVITERKYESHERSTNAQVRENRNYKSLLKYQYKIKGKVFDSIYEISNYYNVPLHTVDNWVKNKVNDDNDMVITISSPINWDGTEFNME